MYRSFFSLTSSIIFCKVLLIISFKYSYITSIDHFTNSNQFESVMSFTKFIYEEPPFLKTTLGILKYYIFVSVTLSMQVCIHCKIYSSTDISSLISHCKTCPKMARPDPFRYKFVCYACSYSSYLLGNIKTHIRTHTGEKPYFCEYCPYKSASSAGLLSHIKCHTFKNKRMKFVR